jgi:hypothetical protein
MVLTLEWTFGDELTELTPTSFPSIFRPNPFEQQEKEHEKVENDGLD